ncbi:MAG: arsenosugar biosynthesis radical SAM protein ArsS [Planctomyces sp.]|nr:arsenosugar biosynthesis radical SAM protein ArsS [Planctomyces sp.]
MSFASAPALTLLRQQSPLAAPSEQLAVLGGPRSEAVPEFDAALAARGLPPLAAGPIEILQVNVGKLCNQTCRHCHVDAGPDRRESMNGDTVDACLRVLESADIPTLDITGGAPEMNPHFRRLASTARKLGRRVIDRCNLTILLAPGFEDLAGFLANQRIEIVASLPCYLESNCDRQRGDGVYQKSIAALRRLNELGYGLSEELPLTLVYNPVGPSLPPPQAKLEADYRRELRARWGVEFTRLYTITNMPISRFLADLLDAGRYEEYLSKLAQAFNSATVPRLMCRNTLSVDWQGRLYDCDFNQMLELPVGSPAPRTIFEFDAKRLLDRPISTARHCYGCTAGAGSSCSGSVAS